MISIKKLTLLTLISVLSTNTIAATSSLTLQNLERERAALLSTLTSGQLTNMERQGKAHNMLRRMADAERMVIRDDRLTAEKTVLARKAFASYDLTFLVHASAEQQKQPLDHWLSTLNISSDAILSSKAGKRQ